MIPVQIFISQEEIDSGSPARIRGMYPRMDMELARATEDTMSIILPAGNSADEIRSRWHIAGNISQWEVLPWVAYLGDSHYLRLLKHSIFNFRLVETASGVLHIPDKTAWLEEVEWQIDNLDALADKRRVPRRAYRTRKNNLRQYLLGDG